jgi:hypothetical protein
MRIQENLSLVKSRRAINDLRRYDDKNIIIYFSLLTIPDYILYVTVRFFQDIFAIFLYFFADSLAINAELGKKLPSNMVIYIRFSIHYFSLAGTMLFKFKPEF